MNRRWLLGSGVVALVAAGGFLFLNAAASAPYAEAASIAEGARDFEDLAGRFEQLAEDKGAVYAFEVLRRAHMPPNTDMHLMGHRVGDILYLQEGIDGMQYCTQDFRNACSHSIVVGALTEFGESALEQIRAACQKAPGGSGAYTMCYHGLGHGVLAFYGYSMPETVTLCSKTGTQQYNDREAVECVGGAVMELAGGGGHDRELWLAARAKYLDDPVTFCTGPLVPNNSQAQCLMYMTPELWKVAGIDLGSPDPGLFGAAFALCKDLRDPLLRESCYAGFGKEFVPLAAARDIRSIDQMSNEAYQRAITWCMSAKETDAIGFCITEGLDSIFWGGENDPEASFRYCSVVEDPTLEQLCLTKLADNIRSYIEDNAKRAMLCGRLPKDVQRLCL